MRTKLYSTLLTALLVTFIGAGSLHAPKAEASGFPTVDIAALIQRIMGYVTQLQDYATQLTSTQTEISQLMQLYEDYTQTLREYEHYLAQLRGLEAFISDAEWEDLMMAFAPYYGASDYSVMPTIDPDSPTFENDIRALLNQQITVPLDQADFDARLAAVNLTSPGLSDTSARLSSAYSRQMDIFRQVARNEDEALERDEDVAEYAALIASLGDQSDVATMQVIATGVQMLLNQQQSAIRLQNQQLLNTELPSAQRAADRAAMLDREIRRLERVQSSDLDSFTVDNLDDF